MAFTSDQDGSFNLPKLATHFLADEQTCVDELLERLIFPQDTRSSIENSALSYASHIRDNFKSQSLVDHLLQEYGLATKEGAQIMRLCEALIRTPDFKSSRLLIRDKLGGADWQSHAGKSKSFVVNRATNGLQLASGWARSTGGTESRSMFAKLGDRVLSASMSKSMLVLGGHFVFAQSIERALKKTRKNNALYSFDMLGEAAFTAQDAKRYFLAYLNATKAIASDSDQMQSIDKNHGISVKLSALHPRYEFSQRERCVPVLVRRLLEICRVAKAANIGVTIDAEESERLEISLIILEQLIKSPELRGWEGLGFVVQAYQRRSYELICQLIDMADVHQTRLCIRLVKGAYWDAEIKRAQELGLQSYPVFTRRENTDLSYLACAQKLLAARGTVYPQFASHNARTLASIEAMAGESEGLELQRLHGMGERIHETVNQSFGSSTRIYAPIGSYQDLLPYLVRRLVENGANSSFLNQLMDETIPLSDVLEDPHSIASSGQPAQHPSIPDPRDLFGGERQSAKGWDTLHSPDEARLTGIGKLNTRFSARSLINGEEFGTGATAILNPADHADVVGHVSEVGVDTVDRAVVHAQNSSWADQHPPRRRAAILRKAAELLEEETDTFLEQCVREAGKMYLDAIAEVREAVDFCRYYADQCESDRYTARDPLGVVACISPWNFPLAIFLGQVTAALSAGNTVVAKPAPQTPIIATEAVKLLHRAGIPKDALHLLIGDPVAIGNALTGHESVDGVCFTGSTRTAKIIAANLAKTGRADTPLIAETGGINAMIVDSTALIEQAAADVVASAFQSAGQRCSACRVVCVQEDIYTDFKQMLIGAMDELRLGKPKDLSTDVGPVIDQTALENITHYIDNPSSGFDLSFQTELGDDCESGTFVRPSLFEIERLQLLEREVFGPVLHMVSYKADEFDTVIDQINALGYGLTLGLHTRIDARVAKVASSAHIGNIYVNRNQIGAVVGVQPFGGEGLSGTGPKAGGPNYLSQLTKSSREEKKFSASGIDISDGRGPALSQTELVSIISAASVASRAWSNKTDLHQRCVLMHDALKHCADLDVDFWRSLRAEPKIQLPGPTGESNSLTFHPRGVLICAGAGANSSKILSRQIALAVVSGSGVLLIDEYSEHIELGTLSKCLERSCAPRDLVQKIPLASLIDVLELPINGVVADGAIRDVIADRLNNRAACILPLLSSQDPIQRFCGERTITINTTASGGNVSLLSLT